jgi:hypothetical protein
MRGLLWHVVWTLKKKKGDLQKKKIVRIFFWGSHLELHLQTKGAYIFLTHVCKIVLPKLMDYMHGNLTIAK